MSGGRTRFSKYSYPAVSYFLDFQLIQIEKTELYCTMFVQVTKMLLNTVFNSTTARQFIQLSEDFALLRFSFRVNLCAVSDSSSATLFRSASCCLFAILISATARLASH